MFWYFPHYHGSGWRPGAAVRIGDWKLIEFYDQEKTELYHISVDFKEEQELSASHPKKTKELKLALAKMLEKTNASLPLKNKN